MWFIQEKPPLLVCGLTTCYKQVKVNTPHLWFSLLTHSQWKWVLFIFQTASRISDPKKKGGKKSPSGKHPSLMFWKERQRKAAVWLHAYCIAENRITSSPLVLIVISYANSISVCSIVIQRKISWWYCSDYNYILFGY